MLWASNQEIIAEFRATTVGCECPNEVSGPWDCYDCPVHGEDARLESEREQQAEIYAENAWLRYAEMPTADDLAFEEYECRMGLV